MNRAAFILFICCALNSAVHADDLFHVGVAKVDVTPTHPVVLAGYGGRQGEHTAVDTRLWARALVIGEAEPVAIVVLDNCGVPAAIRERVVARVAGHGIPSERLVIASTHTHNAPSLEGYAAVLWAGRLDEQQQQHMEQYTEFAVRRMAEAVLSALKTREPMTLSWGRGRLTFGGNRRVLNDGQWAGFGFQRNGPVDHSLPVLVARDASDKVRAVWANYACHCTTAGSANRINGDWAGYAAAALDREFSDAVGLVSIGCGADVGPQPAGSGALAQQHGEALAAEVTRVISREPVRLKSGPIAESVVVELPIDAPQARAFWDEQLRRGGFHNQLAQVMISRLQKSGRIEKTVSYPLTTWKFGSDLVMVFMAGEVVVDYSVLLNSRIDWRRLWLTAWSNDMPGYIPSRRVLREGGYEADFSQVYYAQPGRYLPEVEDVVLAGVSQLVGPSFKSIEGQEPPDFHVVPSGEQRLWRELPRRVDRLPAEQRAVVSRFRNLARHAVNGCTEFQEDDSEAIDWFNFCGDTVVRRFIRQSRVGRSIRWTTAAPAKPGSTVFMFSGGIGWHSQPARGFELQVGGAASIPFDVVRQPTVWKHGRTGMELLFLPTWTSDEDAAGFFLLVVPKGTAMESLELVVRSTGNDSRRWFALDSDQGFQQRRAKLVQHLVPSNAGSETK